MKKIIFTLTIMAIVFSANAQKKAVTENGEEVLLYKDGTWKYSEPSEEEEKKEIPTNTKKYDKPDGASFLLKSNKAKVGFWIDSKKWTFKKAENNKDAEYELQFKKGDLYAMIISEKVEIQLESLRDIAVDNGKSVAPDLEVVKEEYRTVNGQKVLCIKMNGSMQGIKIAYFGYYYSNSEGTVQFVTYTSQNLANEYEEVAENLLNGITKIDN